jgi:hypothetical protein
VNRWIVGVTSASGESPTTSRLFFRYLRDKRTSLVIGAMSISDTNRQPIVFRITSELPFCILPVDYDC